MEMTTRITFRFCFALLLSKVFLLIDVNKICSGAEHKVVTFSLPQIASKTFAIEEEKNAVKLKIPLVMIGNRRVG